MSNLLSGETSPYLLQHADNPVDWYPWGPEALAAARDEDKPILLSIGYSACHWCHVMERESFEDEETAALMNEGFVSVKVDREERPDLDSIYMRAVQASTGRGGWPLTAFLTPDGRYFYGGTYFPPEPRFGMPSFREVLNAVLDAYRNRRDEVEAGSSQILELLKGGPARGEETQEGSHEEPRTREEAGPEARLASRGPEILQGAAEFLRSRFDAAHGGFGPAPKFPQPVTLEFLLRRHHSTGDPHLLEMVLATLRAMARGGIRDQLGGGFHRYSVDDHWLVPHFEKMLYDNALLARVYLQAYQITGDVELEEALTATLEYVLEDLRSPEGGFFSARDADSEGEEGLFYLWDPDEVREVLGEELGALFCRVYDVTASGNFEGRNILHLEQDLDVLTESMDGDGEKLKGRLEEAREKLKEARAHREPPFRDEKVLTGWNSFMLRALAEAGAALDREVYLEAARENAEFLLESLRPGGRLHRSWKDGDVRIPGFLEDYAALGNALLSLHEATLEPAWLLEARSLCDQIVELFWEEEEGLFYDTPHDGEKLVMRPREIMDNATPSGNSLAVELLLRTSRVFGEDRYREVALHTLHRESRALAQLPSAFGRLLSSLALSQEAPTEVVLLGQTGDPSLTGLRRAAHAPYLPGRVVVGGPPDGLPTLPLLEGRTLREGKATAYVCRDFTCSLPLHDPEGLAREIEERAGPGGDADS